MPSVRRASVRQAAEEAEPPCAEAARVNAEDRARLTRCYEMLIAEVERMGPSTSIRLEIQTDRHGRLRPPFMLEIKLSLTGIEDLPHTPD